MAFVVSVDDPVAVDRAAEALLRGEAVVVPTDTVYGLATRADAARSLFVIKDRSPDVPIAVLVADIEQARPLLADLSPWATELVRRHWPGPLTIVAERRAGVVLDLGEPAHTIGVRCPDHGLVRALAGRVGPLATTSANRHGQATPATAGAVVDQLGEGLAPDTVVVDGGPCPGTPSTVVDVTGRAPVVLRQGELDIDG
jgi:L-threonylcarbamoyladenylate synthase